MSQAVAVSKSKPVILSAADQLLSKSTTRFFVVRFFGLTAALFLIGFAITSTISIPGVRTALYYGMAFPAIASFISFLISEWAFEKPTGIFLGVSVGSMVLRVCNMLFAFVMGLVVFKMNAGALIFGLLGTYFSLLVIEISYFHNKGKLLPR